LPLQVWFNLACMSQRTGDPQSLASAVGMFRPQPGQLAAGRKTEQMTKVTSATIATVDLPDPIVKSVVSEP
jgi:hypothetical protein